MKRTERRHLKQNEFVQTVVKVTAFVREYQKQLVAAGVAVVVIAAVVAGVFWWRNRTEEEAGALLGTAMTISQAPISPAPTVPGAGQAAGTYPTEQARAEAALAAFRQVASAYPSSLAGIQATYQEGDALMTLGRYKEAEQAFQDVAGRGNAFFAPFARLGLAQAALAQGDTEQAIKIDEELAAARDSALPTDGVLMQLGQAYLKAGKKAEAKSAFQRVVDEFPSSPYAADARQQVTALG